MRSSSSKAAADPWAPDIDSAWRDLVVSSAPPPPPRDAFEPLPKNRALPADLHTWQEHGKPITAEHPKLEEPHFTDGDRRLWMIAGALMGLAVLVLGVLGVLTFGNPAGDAAALAASAPVATTAAPSASTPAAAAAAPARTGSTEKHAALASAAIRPTFGPRTAKHAKKSRHHKRVAQR